MSKPGFAEWQKTLEEISEITGSKLEEPKSMVCT
jgi:hypothetical protein